VKETESGTFVQATITEFGELAIVITKLAGNELTAEAATTTGDDQVVGTATVAGTTTNDETATETIALDGID
jgi:hypothetical protein